MSEKLSQTGLDNKDICHLKSQMREEKKRKEGGRKEEKGKERRKKYPEVRGALGNG